MFYTEMFGPGFEDAVCHFRQIFTTFAFISWLLFEGSRHLLTVILVLPGGTGGGGSTIIIRVQQFKIILTTE